MPDPKWKKLEKKKRHPDVRAYFERLPLEARVMARRLDELVHEAAPDALEAVYWGVPFYFGKEDGIAYLSAAKTHVTLGFPNGDRMDDPSGTLVGTGKSPIRKATLKLSKPLDEALVRAWLAQAVALSEA